MGRDEAKAIREAERESFNPRARMGRDDYNEFLVHLVQMFQSTRPYGARLPCADQFSKRGLFQSTRPYGARRFIRLTQARRWCFNPRARMGRDAADIGY